MELRNSLIAVVFFLGVLHGLGSEARAGGPGKLKFDEETFEAFEESGTALIAVERSNGEDGAISVTYSASAGTATAGSDFTPTAGTLNWNDGDGSSKTFVVILQDDEIDEPAETILLSLSQPTGGATIDAERGDATLILGASDGGGGGGGGDDDAGVFSISQGTFLATESAGVAVITVQRTLGDDGVASVDYRTTRGTASPGEDYTDVSGTLTWADSNDDTQTFSIPIRNDDVHEDTETVHLALSNATGGAQISTVRGSALLEIRDDDPIVDGGEAGVLHFDERSFEVFEDEMTATLAVERSQGSTGAVSVIVRTADGSALNGLDYEASEQILTWEDGEEGLRTTEVVILQDVLFEGNESVALSLGNAAGGVTIDAERGESELTIFDDDGDTSPCVEGPETLCLGDDGQFSAQIVWRTRQGDTGPGAATTLSTASGAFSFFDVANIEMLVKVLDGCAVNGSQWVFFSATTNVDFTVTVTDTATGKVKQYLNPQGQNADPILDTRGFASCL